MDMAGVERINLNTLGGTDSAFVGAENGTNALSDLSTTEVQAIDLALGSDGVADTVFVDGRPLDDDLLVSVANGIVKVAGLPYDVPRPGRRLPHSTASRCAAMTATTQSRRGPAWPAPSASRSKAATATIPCRPLLSWATSPPSFRAAPATTRCRAAAATRNTTATPART